jgi:hypothetical protein
MRVMLLIICMVSLDVENAEDDLVQKTEVAIQQMKAVLDNPEPVKNLNELVKAQVCAFPVFLRRRLTLVIFFFIASIPLSSDRNAPGCSGRNRGTQRGC